MAKASEDTQVKVTFRLPEDLYDIYAERGAKTNCQPEVEMIKTLSRCRSHNDASPIYVNDSARNSLTQIANKTMTTSADLINWTKSMVSIKVNGIEIQLSPQTLQRLDSRRFGNITMGQLLQQIVPELLETFVGMR